MKCYFHGLSGVIHFRLFNSSLSTFGMFLVHASLDNRTPDRIRLSSDSRYQRASEPIDERWVGPNPPGHSAAGKLGRIC